MTLPPGSEIVVLSGGAGTRLWPLSRTALPKQFHDFLGQGKPLLVETLERLRPLGGTLTVLTTEKLKAPSLGLLNRYGLEAEVWAEPLLRNTAPAILWASLKISRKNPQAVVGVFPADHHIADSSAFHQIVDRGFEEARKGNIVTLGISPTEPSTAYGYIELGPETSQGIHPIERFIEKPQRTRAEELLKSKNVVWNAGMFLFRVDVMLEAFRKHLPGMWKSLQNLSPDEANLEKIYASLESVSIDVGIMEKIENLLCLPAAMGWSDIGSWEEVARRSSQRSPSVEVGGSGNFVVVASQKEHPVAFVGVSDLIFVETEDAFLVLKKGEGQRVREAVEKLKAQAPACLDQHPFEERPWGSFRVLMDTEHFKSKHITVLPGHKLSYQSHARRAEHWVVVRGQAQVTLNDAILALSAGEHVFIPQGAKHRMENPGSEVLEFIEVQTGSYFGEDDIVRYSDVYGRSRL